MGKLESNKKKKEDALYNTAFELFTTKGTNKTTISDIVALPKPPFMTLPRMPVSPRELFICISKINMISETNWPLPKRRIYFSLHIWLFVRIRSQVFLLSSIL